MSTTDRTPQFETACCCGAGHFRISQCTPEHGWLTATPVWYEPLIACAACDQAHTIEQQCDAFVLVTAAERERRRRRRDAVSTRAGQILAAPTVRAALAQLQTRLGMAADKSVAAAYRYLDAVELISCSLSTFRNHWRGVTHWIAHEIRLHDLPKVFAAVGQPPGQLTAWLQQLDVLQAAADQPAQGPLLCQLP